VKPLALHCLNSVCDDYENVSLIRTDVQKAMAIKVGDKEIEECLTELVRQGLVGVFECDARGHYVASDVSEGDWDKKWFLITETGRRELDEHWIET